jgi:hypothetical protein
MKKIILGLIVLSSLPTFASEKVVRLDKDSISSIETNVLDCTMRTIMHGDEYKANHVISVQTKEGVTIDFTIARVSLGPDGCSKAKEEAKIAHSQRLIFLNSIKKGTLSVIEKKENVVCARSYIDVAIDEDGKILNSITGVTPVKCP